MELSSITWLVLLLASGEVFGYPVDVPVEYDYPASLDYNVGSEDLDVIQELTDCIEYKSEPGRYRVQRGPSTLTCGLYLVAPADSQVDITFEEFEVDCQSGGVVEVVDAYVHAGNIFPPTEDLQGVKRHVKKYCEPGKPIENFRSSGNTVVIQNRLPKLGDNFQLVVKFVTNPKPCNAVILGDQGTFSLQNYGSELNCSVLMLFPQRLSLRRFSVAAAPVIPIRASVEDVDYLEIRGGNSSSLSSSKIFERLSGHGLRSQMYQNIMCESVIVRLVSSGLYHNYVEVYHELLKDYPMALPVMGRKTNACLTWSSNWK